MQNNPYYWDKMPHKIISNIRKMKKINLQSKVVKWSGYSGGYSGSSLCYWESGSSSKCTNDPNEIYHMGTYFWCCNCAEAEARCGDL